MAKYVAYKTKKFPLKKDAMAWAKKEKKAYQGVKNMKIETNFNPDESQPWQAIVLMKQ